MHAKFQPRRRIAGFTLLELMIAVAIVGIIGAIAFPSFTASVRKGRRADAVDAAANVLQAQERWRANNVSYTTSLSNLKIASSTTTSGYYTFAISATSGTGYTLTFTPASGKGQDKDTSCTSMVVTVNLGTPAYTPTTCWSR